MKNWVAEGVTSDINDFNFISTQGQTKYIKIGEKSFAYFQNASSEYDFTPFQNNHQTSRQTAIFILCPTLWIIFKIKYILREIHCCAAGVIQPTISSLSSFRIMLWTTVQWEFFFSFIKVHIFWEGHKILWNLPLTFEYRDFAKFVAFSEYMNFMN